MAEAGLRVLAGLLLLPHGAQKLLGLFGADRQGEAALFAAHGFRPGPLWVNVAGVIQLGGGALLALGLFTRPAALVLALMLLATLRVTARGGWFWNRGGSEYPVLWAAVCLLFVIKGGGAYSLDQLLKV